MILYFISNVKFIYSNSNLTKTEVLKKETKLNFNFNLKIQNKMNTNSLKKSDKDILWEGWIKYIKLKNVSNVKKPSNFFINDQFYNQRVYKSEIDLKDELGSFKYIPSKFFFYAKLSNHTFNIISSKESQISSNFDSIIISNIKQIPLEKKLRYEGGINILGDFNEGYCFQVITDKEVVLKVAIDVTYVICTNSSKDRDYLVEKMIDLKILDQNNGEIINVNETPKNSLSDDENLSRGKIFSPKDGRWILLKNWSQCSLKCGGGQQFQQWMCIQPRPGGKPCVGSPILTRECNINPCPKYGISKKESNFEEEIELKPIIETRPFSQRKQQRILCKIRETHWLKKLMEETLLCFFLI